MRIIQNQEKKIEKLCEKLQKHKKKISKEKWRLGYMSTELGQSVCHSRPIKIQFNILNEWSAAIPFIEIKKKTLTISMH